MADKAFIIYKITPKDMDNISETEKEVRGIKSGIVKDVKREPIGFGIELIKVGVLVNEKETGAMEKVTKELQALSSVEEVEQEAMTLL
jgi:translation elongation factor EF-1beta